jgi:hypothetical protein
LVDPGDDPPEGATPKEREAWRRDRERFLTENFKHLPAAPAKVDPTDKRLQELRRHHGRFMEMHSPMKASIWLALLRPAKDILHDAEMSRRFQEAQAGGKPGEYVAPSQPAIIEIGQQLVAQALRGDVSAIDRISDRIEGKAGLRAGDEDPDDPAKRKQTQDITERVIRALTKGRIDSNKPGDDAKAITDVKVIEPEPLDKLVE